MRKGKKDASKIEPPVHDVVPQAGSNLGPGPTVEGKANYTEVLRGAISTTGVLDTISEAKDVPREAPPKIEKGIKAGTGVLDQDMVDDPVRMYLREIGRVRLLSARDERILARKMEGSKHISTLENRLQEIYGRYPTAVETIKGLLENPYSYSASATINTLGSELGLSPPITLGQLVSPPQVTDSPGRRDGSRDCRADCREGGKVSLRCGKGSDYGVRG